METFLEYSQRLKEQITNDPKIIEAIRACFSGDTEVFAKGTEHEIYRLGKVSPDIYLALRKRIYDFDIENATERLQIYCQNAETLAGSRANGLVTQFHREDSPTPSFCIAVIYQSKEVGIITEDMSEGGKYEMTNRMGDVYCERMLGGQVVDEVLVDLDACHVNYFDDREIRATTPYFSSELVLLIS